MTMLQPQTKKEEGLINVVHLDLTKALGTWDRGRERGGRGEEEREGEGGEGGRDRGGEGGTERVGRERGGRRG